MDFIAFKKFADTVFAIFFTGNAIVADERVRKSKNLAMERWIGNTLRVADHACGKNHFAGAGGFCSKDVAVEGVAVFEDEFAFFHGDFLEKSSSIFALSCAKRR